MIQEIPERLTQYLRHFVLGQDHREALGLLRTHDVLQPADVLLQDLLIQKQDSA